MTTILLFVCATTFMNIAWYAHLKFKGLWMPWAVLGSWGIAFFEYCIRIPANRIGHGQFTIAQLQIAYLVVNLFVFLIFLKLYFGETPSKNEWISFLFLIGAGYFGYLG